MGLPGSPGSAGPNLNPPCADPREPSLYQPDTPLPAFIAPLPPGRLARP
jgi:hypothetical protein